MPVYFKKFLFHLNNKYYELQKSIHDLNSVGVEITGRCDLRCKHCYMDSCAGNFPEEINTGEWIAFFSQLNKDFGNKIVIQITGGEPLVRLDLFDILRHIKELGFRVSLASNGLLLNDKNIIELKKYISSLSISIDGLEESHNYLRNADTFQKVIGNIKNARKMGLKNITIKTAVFKRNLEEMEKMFKLVCDLEADNWHIFAMEPIGRSKKNMKDILSKKEYGRLCDFIDKLHEDKKNKITIIFEEQSGLFLGEKTFDSNKFKLCNAGISSCAILYNGNIASCVQGDRTDTHGNIKNCDFKKIWYNEFINNRSKQYKCCQNHYFAR